LVHKTSLTPPLFIEVPVLSQEVGGPVFVSARGIDFASFYDLAIGFWNCSDKVWFFFVILLAVVSARKGTI